MEKLIYTETELKAAKDSLTPQVYEILFRDLSDSWTCLLCGELAVKANEPVTGFQCICCASCGQTCLRPTRECTEG